MDIESRSILLVVLPRSFVHIAVAEDANSATLAPTVLPVADVLLPVGEDVLPVTISLAPDPVSRVSCTVLPDHFAHPAPLAVLPLSGVELPLPRVVGGVGEHPDAMVLAILPLALVLLAVAPDQGAPPAEDVVLELALVLVAPMPGQHSVAVLSVVGP